MHGLSLELVIYCFFRSREAKTQILSEHFFRLFLTTHVQHFSLFLVSHFFFLPSEENCHFLLNNRLLSFHFFKQLFLLLFRLPAYPSPASFILFWEYS